MRFMDYLRLGFAGVKAHKKRALTVVIIVGVLFSVITAGAFVLQGLENVVSGEMLKPTDGKVLVMSMVDTKVCDEECDIEAEVAKIKQNIAKYGGKIIEVEVAQTADGMFYKLKQGVFASSSESADVTEVVVPLATAANLAGIEMPERDAEVVEKIEAIKEVREKTLGKTIESKSSEKHYVADILPSGVYASDLSFMNIGQSGNPLDLIFSQVRTGASQNFITKSAEAKPKSEDTTSERPSGFMPAENVNVEEMGLVFAEFDSIKAAFDYYWDEVNYCSENDRIFGTCGRDYKYQVLSAVSDPLTTYENLQNVWLVFRIVAAVLGVIAVIIALSTYARLIGKDMKIISLYHAMGATGKQIRIVYIVYLMMLSVMAVGFALVVGLGLAAVLSMVNMTALEQMFMLGFGVVKDGVWLIGWNSLLWYLIGAMMLTAVVAVCLGNGNFKVKELAKRMK